MSTLSLLKKWTHARIHLGRTGSALKTKEVLEFRFAQALAQDALRKDWDPSPLKNQLEEMQERVLVLSSEARTKDEFLMRPDLGRKLSQKSKKILDQWGEKSTCEAVFIVTEGLSTDAVNHHFYNFWKAFKKLPIHFPLDQIIFVLIPFGRVALSDEIGQCLGAKLSVIFVGERPGLSSPDSLGIYLTFGPKIGNSDSNRNCISNIRTPGGLSYKAAAIKLNYLIAAALKLGCSGTLLKDESHGSFIKLET